MKNEDETLSSVSCGLLAGFLCVVLFPNCLQEHSGVISMSCDGRGLSACSVWWVVLGLAARSLYSCPLPARKHRKFCIEKALLFVCLSSTSVSLLQSRHVVQGKQGALCVGSVWGTAQRAVLGAGSGAARGSLLLHLYGMGRNGPVLWHCSSSVKLKGKEMRGKEKEGKTSAVKEEGVDSNWE